MGEAILDTLRTTLARQLGRPAAELDPDTRFRALGADSLKVTAWLAEAGTALGRALSPLLAWQHPTLAALAAHLAQAPLTGAAAPRAALPRTGPPRAAADGPVALIGMACRFPGGATDPDALWRLLADGVDTIAEVPPARWPLGSWYDADPEAPGRMRTRWGGFLPDVAGFDAAYFGISPREAAQMDPQQRLLLELAVEALGDAAIAPGRLQGSRTGVFAGIIWQDWAQLLVRAGARHIDGYSATGAHHSIAANRISYALGLMGPSLAVDTACSSSLVAVHLAAEALRRGECDLALAGGVNLMLAPDGTVAMSKFGAMAPDGRCKAFDARADGYVRGEGAGLVVLKPLARAEAEGDRILAVLRGGAINNDGPSNGLTAPNPAAQEAVLAEALARAGLPPEALDAVEAHGTGTLLGDPIEARALGAVLGRGRPAGRPLLLGSIKTNIGHTEAAAGIAGLMKAVLMLRHRAAPPSLHFRDPNPMIPFAELGLTVPTRLTPLAGEGPLRIGVSSFGFGGTNAHLILESAPEPPAAPVLASPPPRRVAFVFSGQGGQWAGMGRALMVQAPLFRAAFLRADRAVREAAGFSPLEEIARPEGEGLASIDRIQPTLFAWQVAMAEMLAGLGLRPAAVLGHSVGEVAAAVAAGALSLRAGARVVAARSALMRRTAGQGAMLAVQLGAREAEAALAALPPIQAAQVSLAAENAPGASVLAGAPEVLQAMAATLGERGVECGFIRVDVASHSPQMAPLLPELAARLAGLVPLPAEARFVSAVRAAPLPGEALDAAYWCDNLRQPVRFAEAAALLDGCDAVVEVGPHPVLAGALERLLPGLPVLPAARRDEELPTCRATAARLGLDIGRGAATPGTPCVLPLSARDAGALDPLAQSLAARLDAAPLPEWAGLAAERTDHAEHRLAVLAPTAELAAAALRDPARRILGCRPPAGAPGLVLVFTGQGTAWAGMGAGLEAEPEARDTLREASAILAREAGWNLAEALTAPPADPAIAQPAQVALQVALGRQMLAWGFRPRAVLGHSLGEIAAACVAGVLTLDDALRLALARGAAMRPLAGRGAMAALALPAEEVRGLLATHPDVALAAINAPARSVVAGPPAALEAFLATLPEVAAPRRLDTDLAFHHPMTAPAREALEAALHGLAPRPATIPLISTVTGALLAGEAMGAMHWGANLRHPVRFAEALRAAGPGLMLEIGPHPALGGAIAETLPEATPLATLRRGRPAAASLREAAARLWAAGLDPDWALLAPPWAPGTTQARLPAYPWQRRRHWLPEPEAVSAPAPVSAHLLLGTRTDAATGPVLFQGAIAPEAPGWIADHVLHGAVVVPAVAYLETLLAAAAALGRSGAALTAIAFPEALVLAPGERRLFQTVAEGDRLRLFHRPEAGGAWRLCAEARMAEAMPPPLPPATTDAAMADAVMTGAEFYAGFASRGGGLGPAFRVLGALRHGPGAVSAAIALPVEARDGGPWRLHPVLLDSLLQLPNLIPGLEGADRLHVPVEIGTLALGPAHGPPVRAELRWDPATPPGAEALRCEGALLDGDGAVVAWLSGLVARRARPEAFAGGAIPFRTLAFTPVELPEAATTDAEILDLRDLPPEADLATACAGLAAQLVALPAGRRLWLVTRDEGDALSLALQGCGRALALERPAAWGGLVAAAPGVNVARATALEGAPELRLTPRGAARRALVAAAPPEGVARLSGAWLVTGASGALGLVAAEELAACGATAIALLARRRPDPAAPRLAALAARGVRLLPLAADLAEPGAAARALAEAEAALGPLEGVLHAAGETADALAADLTPDHLRRALAAKLGGARALAAARRPGTRLVLFGSLAGLLGAPGQAAYAAANAALGAVPDAVLVGWPAWRGQGMAARGNSAWQGREVGMIEEAQGRRLLRALLAAPPGAYWPMPEGTAVAEEGALARRLRALPPRARRAAAEEAIGRMVAELLGLDPGTLPDPRRGFFDLGMDSLLVVRLRNRLGAELGAVLPQGVVFDHPNLGALAGFALGTLPPDAPARPEPEPEPAAAEGDLAAALAAELAKLGH